MLSSRHAKGVIDAASRNCRKSIIHVSNARAALAGRCDIAKVGNSELYYMLAQSAEHKQPMDWIIQQVNAIPAVTP